MPRPIPDIRADMSVLALEMRKEGFDHWADRLEQLAEDAKRKPMVKKAANSSTPMSAGLAASIRAYSENHPHRSHQEIANFFKVNPGRVSEALHYEV